MTAAFPTHRQEEWRYADLDALKPVWERFAEPVTLTVGAGESLEEVWLPAADDVQLRRVQLALGDGAKARIFALNTAAVYGRIELEVSLAEAAEFELFGANIGTGLSTNEIVTNVKHLGVGGRSRQTVRSVLNGKAVGSYLGKVDVARGAQQTDAEQSVKAMVLDRGATANCKPELEIFADVPDVGDDFVGREARADVGSEQLEIRAFRKAHLELGPAIFRGGVEHEDPRFRSGFESDLDAAHQHVIVARKPDFLEALAGSDGEGQRLGELLPNRPQRVEVGVAPFLLLVRREGRGHAAAST